MDIDTAHWRVWSTRATLTVSEPSALPLARRIAEELIARVDRAASRFRPDSELTLITGRTSAGIPVSPLLAELIAAALEASERTEGDVDPTLGARLAELGYDRDIRPLRAIGEVPVTVHRLGRPSHSWRDVRLSHGVVTMPDDIALDLGASAKAFAADWIAGSIAERLGCAVLVGLGGDLASAGPRDDPWQVLVEDLPGDPAQQVSLVPGWALATSSTQHRRWRAGGRAMHHILDPRSGLPAAETWRTATVAAPSCLHANALSTAAIVRGIAARGWLGEQGVAARFVDAGGRVSATSAWPAPQLESVPQSDAAPVPERTAHVR